jgi:hypothetical protein
LTEFEGELEEVSETVFNREDHTIVQVPLDHDEADALRRLAQSRGMKDTDLVKEWGSEKLHAS